MGYSRDELFGLWQGFRGQTNELRMMQDFALCDQKEAHRGEVQYCVAKRRRGRPKSVIRERFPEIAALVDNPPATYTQAPDTSLISRLTAAEIVKQAMEAAKVK